MNPDIPNKNTGDQFTADELNKIVASIYSKADDTNPTLSQRISTNTAAIAGAISGFRGFLMIADPEPTVDGVYFPLESGVYVNEDNISVDLNAGSVQLLRSNGNWAKQVTPITLTDYVPKTDFIPVQNQVTNLVSAISVDGSNLLNIVDAAGNIGLQLTSSAVLRAFQIVAGLITPTAINMGSSTLSANDDYLFVITDINGWIGWAIKKDLTILQYTPGNAAPIPSADVRVKPFDGQSLSLGTNSVADTTTTTPGVYTFNAGPIVPDADAGYVSLRLSTSVGTECPSEASTRMARQSLFDLGVFPVGSPYIQDYILYNPGAGGVPIVSLRKGTASYTRLLKGLTRAKALSDGAFKTSNMPAFEWMQGEGNILDNTTKDSYKSQMVGLYNEVNADAKLTFGQLFDCKMLTYQTASHLHYGGTTAVALAQLENSLAGINIYMAAAMYPYDYGVDTLHMANAEQYERVGALFGHVYSMIVDFGIDWKPIYPNSWIISGTVLEVKFDVPVLPLVLDTTIVVDPGNYGFRLFDGSNTEITINSVVLTRPDTIKIIAAATVSAGCTLTYAINGTAPNTGRTLGARGCLRDSQGDTVIYDPTGKNYKLHNWTPIFQQTL